MVLVLQRIHASATLVNSEQSLFYRALVLRSESHVPLLWVQTKRGREFE